MIASATMTAALGHVARLHQLVLDGTIIAIRVSGTLDVSLGGTAVTATALVDQRFRVAERVRMMYADDNTYQVIGLAPTGQQRILTGTLPVTLGAVASTTSSSLQAAVQRYAVKEAQALKAGRLNAISADGSLEVQLRSGAWPARAITDMPFRAGMKVYAIKTDRDNYLVVGAH
jgi:hypothetical protein